MRQIDKLLSSVTIGVGVTMIALMILQICLDAALRTTAGLPLPGTVEIVSNYYMVALSFLPAALVQRQGRNIEATFLYTFLPRVLKRMADIFARLLAIVVYGLITWQSFLDAMTKTRIKAYALAGTIEIPIWPCYWLVPLSFGLLVIALALPPAPQDADAGIPEVR
ncbi:TRAP transporter small permease [Roseibium litorale]|uniref:TRAP transporter small permease protein n=1 Tax=Roseibium litorale TaxID=2803841 RepID=A0ABR9CQR5_9HYPH|nr:TRAP transporter small permease [Roseibium litorale]MBD8892601.1 TRAP transporter small permease [Roseibium litorale]